LCSCIKEEEKKKDGSLHQKIDTLSLKIDEKTEKRKNMSVLPHFFCRGYLQCKKKILVYISFMIHSLHVFEEFGIFKGIYILSLLV